MLVVDLDGTLSRTDTLHESLLRLAVKQPLALPGLLGPLRAGKPAFKAHVAGRLPADPQALAFDADVLVAIEAARAAGQRVELVSASDHRVVRAVADHLGLFDAAIGTGSPEAEGRNLGGAAKAEFLTARHGAGGFDYIGDSAVDLPVWAAAARAYAPRPPARLLDRARAAGVTLQALPATDPKGTPEHTQAWKPLIKAMRPHQWSKNILVFMPMLAAQQPGAFWPALLAFVLFSLTASCTYILNDLVDIPSDRAHPRKCRRPFASGALPIATGLGLAAGLFGAVVLLALALMPPLFQAALAFYFAVTLAYSFVLKRKLMVDVITLAGLYTMRIIAGAAASSILPSPWLLAFSVFLFFSLAAIKRQAELVDQAASGKASSPGRAYLSSDVDPIRIMAISAGQAAVLVFALYLYSPAVTELYSAPEVLWLICPVLLYWLSRIALLTHRGFMNDDPIVFAARDRISWAVAAVVLVILLAAEQGWVAL